MSIRSHYCMLHAYWHISFAHLHIKCTFYWKLYKLSHQKSIVDCYHQFWQLKIFKTVPRKFKGGIHCGGHLEVTCRAELLTIVFFHSLACQASVSCPSTWTKSCMHNGYHTVNHMVYKGNARRSRRMIRPNLKVQ